MNANLSRRGFLGALAAALVLDPERLLWVPGKKLISIPALPKIIDPLEFKIFDEINAITLVNLRRDLADDTFCLDSSFLKLAAYYK